MTKLQMIATTLALAASLSPTALAFTTTTSLPLTASANAMPSSFALSSTQSSDSEVMAVQAALEATQRYGATSRQARVLWDEIEERRSADNSQATKPGILDEECYLDENGINEACLEYHDKMAELIHLMHEYEDWRDLVAEQHMFDNFKTLTRDLSVLKLNVNTAKQQSRHVDSPAAESALAEAIQLAKQATDLHGIHSSEAKLQWETVEEIASAGLENAMGPSNELYELLDEECLVEQASEACLALEELHQTLNDNAAAAQAIENNMD